MGSADWHLGLTRYGSPAPGGSNTRIRDQIATLNRFADAAIENKVDLAIFAGDTFATRRDGPEERAAFMEVGARLWGEAGILSLIVDGNHDGKTTVGDLDSAAIRYMLAAKIPWLIVYTEPTVTTIEVRGERLGIVAVPYPHKRALDEELRDVEPAERVLVAADRLTDWVTKAADLIPSVFPKLFVGHLTVDGSIAGSETSMKTGWDVGIHPRVLERFDLAVLGHIHRYQQVGDPAKSNAFYAGSPEYIDFTEAGLTKGWILASLSAGSAAVEIVPTGSRPMVTMQAVLLNEEWHVQVPDPAIWAQGPIIRVIAKVDAKPSPRLLADLQRMVRERGAVYVQTDVIQPQREVVRAEVLGLTVEEATERHLRSTGFADVEAAMVEARRIIGGIAA